MQHLSVLSQNESFVFVIFAQRGDGHCMRGGIERVLPCRQNWLKHVATFVVALNLFATPRDNTFQ